MLSRTSNKTNPSGKGLEGERLSSDISDSSDDSGIMAAKKQITGNTLNAPHDTSSQKVGPSGPSYHSTSKDLVPAKNGQLSLGSEVFESGRRPSAGMIKVKLASASPQWDNKAEVEVDCENPDEVVDKMLQSIVDKFPPTSVLTVERAGMPLFGVPLNQMGGGYVPGQNFYDSNGNVMGGGFVPGQNPMDRNRMQGGGGMFPRQPYYPQPARQPQRVPKPSSQALHPGYPQDNKKGHAHGTVSSVGSIPSKNEPGLIHEVPKFVPKVEVREILREVPKYEAEWIEKHVHVPEIQYVDKYVEIPEVQEVVRHVPKFEIVEIPKEVTKYVPRVQTKIVENIIEVPRGQKINVMRPQPIETNFILASFEDRNVPVVLSHCIIPEIEETDEVLEVEVNKYVPFLVPVDVYVPLPVSIPLKMTNDGTREEVPVTDCDPKLLQQLMIEMNPHLQQLEMFNFQQHEQFNMLVNQSIQQAQEYCVVPPQPIYNNIVAKGASNNPSRTHTFQRSVSKVSRSSSTSASRRPPPPVSRRVTGNANNRMASGMVPMMPPQQAYYTLPPTMYQSDMPHNSTPPLMQQ